MNTFNTCVALGALSFAAVLTQAQETTQSPTPSTSEAEGTAADRTSPGQTPTQQQPDAAMTNPQPATSPTEGTAADHTPPGRTSTATGTTTPTRTAEVSGSKGSDMVGSTVVSSDQTPLGKIVDVVSDAQGQPEFLVITTKQGQSAAVPYETASAMKSGNRVVMDESRLEAAPTLQRDEWRGQSDKWKAKSAKYWGKQ